MTKWYKTNNHSHDSRFVSFQFIFFNEGYGSKVKFTQLNERHLKRKKETDVNVIYLHQEFRSCNRGHVKQ